MTIAITWPSTFTVTLLLGYFVCVAQGYHNRDYKLFSIIRVNDQQGGKRVDQVESSDLRQCMTNRQLSALVYVYGRERKWTGITNHEIVDFCQKYQNFLIVHEWMSSDLTTAPSDIIAMFDDVRKSSSVLRQYLDSVLDQETENAILFVMENEGETSEINDKMDSYIRPFTDKVIDEYDFAIDYITRQYQEQCLSNFGIVQQNKLYYLKVSWSSVTRIDPQCCQDDNDMTLWKAFMTTACPVPNEDFKLFDRIGKPTLNLVNFSREIEMPKELESLLPYLPMIKRSTIGGLVDQLVASFKQYKKMSESQRKVHDEDLLVGYQKKFIVLQTIVRMMYEDPSMTERSENVGIAGITAAIGGYKSIQSHLTPNHTTQFPNITLSPKSGSMDRGISHQTEPVWLFVGVMIIVASVLVSAVLCLVRGKKRKRNDGYKDKTSKTSSTSNNRSTI